MKAVLWDLNGTLVHNNKSLGTGDLPEGYGSDDPDAAVKAFLDGKLPKAYYLTSPEDIVWIDGALEALKVLYEHAIRNIIITNQEHIFMGITTPKKWKELEILMTDQVRDAGGDIAEWYYCSHRPGDGCPCRKRSEHPGLYLFYRCAVDYQLQLYDTYYIGDNISDMVAGKLAGCKTIMVKTPKQYDLDMVHQYADHVVEDALAAAKLILEGPRQL